MIKAAVSAALLLTLIGPSLAHADEKNKIALVIDDFGNGMNGTAQMKKLPIAFTAAIMPFMPTTKADAEAMFQLGHDVIVHLPMEPNQGKPEWLGPGAILTRMSDEEIRSRTEAAIQDVPHAVGMNNHMGSKATSDPRVMRIVLQVCKEHGLFFLDSRTTHRSVISQIGSELDVAVLRNDMFLDDQYSASHIAGQINKLTAETGRTPALVAIGHVGPPGKLTAAAIEQAVPRLRRQASFVHLSELLPSISRERQILP
ncbi:divergent polysaccharide deacetylase family protein [Paenibacillus sp. IB182496]|uniref:Divergent polysaccharide deacetylase family protein n=1 Tax=Paenibacillus sabuli TaxID=2772509 RepID=A0A927GUP0_9BACL|nr:divergent polysaccharide deacetylase family protein [Paenibacillus sabuli]